MMTVRFASGFSVQYNDANFAQRHATYTDLSTKENGTWIAQVPNDALIEVRPACTTYNPVSQNFTRDVTNEIESLRKEIRSLKRKLTK